MSSIQRLLNDKELAKILNCGEQKLRQDRHEKKGIPYLKIGRTVRYRLKDVEDFLESRVVIPTQGTK